MQEKTDERAAGPDDRPLAAAGRVSSGRGTLYWHILLGDQPQVVGLARQAQQRLARFTGLHMTPATWLHITTLVAGPADNLTDHDIEAIYEYLSAIPCIEGPAKVSDLPPQMQYAFPVLHNDCH